MQKLSPSGVAAIPAGTTPGGRPKAGARCRANWEPALHSFLTVLDRASSNGTIAMDQVHRLATAFLKAEGALGELFAQSELACSEAFAAADLERKRQDHFGRLVARPFAPLFLTSGGLERRHLPQFFSALKMILGDEVYADLRSRTKLIAEAHRGDDGNIDWNAFHADRQAILILDRVRFYIARSFRRFDPRKDWFLLVMNQAHSAVSLASNAFVAKAADDRGPPPFTERHMFRLFDALFDECDPKALSTERKANLSQAGGNDAEERIRQFRHNVRMGLLRLGEAGSAA